MHKNAQSRLEHFSWAVNKLKMWNQNKLLMSTFKAFVCPPLMQIVDASTLLYIYIFLNVTYLVE